MALYTMGGGGEIGYTSHELQVIPGSLKFSLETVYDRHLSDPFVRTVHNNLPISFYDARAFVYV